MKTIDRLYASGEISRQQFEAAVRYAEIAREYTAALVAGHDAPNYRTATKQYDTCRAALRDAAREDEIAPAVVDAVAVSDQFLPHLTPALRLGLNHLVRAVARCTPMEAA